MTGAILYDLDGVIVDSRTLVAAALTDVATTALGHPPSVADVADVLHLPPVRALHVLGVADPERAFDDGFDLAYATHAGKAVVVPGIVAVMRRRRAAGVRQAVVTLQRRHRLTLLSLGDVPDLIDTFVTFEDATPKPAPDPVLVALDRLNVPADQAWFIGDTVTDIVAGHAAGVPVAVATWGYATAETLEKAGADLLLTEPEQIMMIALTNRSVTVGYDRSASGVARTERAAPMIGGDGSDRNGTADGGHGGAAS